MLVISHLRLRLQIIYFDESKMKLRYYGLNNVSIWWILSYGVQVRVVLWGPTDFLLPASSLVGFFFDAEDGDEIFLRNVSSLSVEYMALYPGRNNAS
jgi:hypothetical protein